MAENGLTKALPSVQSYKKCKMVPSIATVSTPPTLHQNKFFLASILFIIKLVYFILATFIPRKTTILTRQFDTPYFFDVKFLCYAKFL